MNLKTPAPLLLLMFLPDSLAPQHQEISGVSEMHAQLIAPKVGGEVTEAAGSGKIRAGDLLTTSAGDVVTLRRE